MFQVFVFHLLFNNPAYKCSKVPDTNSRGFAILNIPFLMTDDASFVFLQHFIFSFVVEF